MATGDPKVSDAIFGASKELSTEIAKVRQEAAENSRRDAAACEKRVEKLREDMDRKMSAIGSDHTVTVAALREAGIRIDSLLYFRDVTVIAERKKWHDKIDLWMAEDRKIHSELSEDKVEWVRFNEKVDTYDGKFNDITEEFAAVRAEQTKTISSMTSAMAEIMSFVRAAKWFVGTASTAAIGYYVIQLVQQASG